MAFDGMPREVFLHEKELEAIGLDVPQVTKIASALRARGFDIPEDLTTVEDAKAAILHYLQAK